MVMDSVLIIISNINILIYGLLIRSCQFVRVVKEADSKSAGFTRTGSNPVADEFFIFLYNYTIIHLSSPFLTFST